ncbi:hypothetical protein [Actinomadura napierensis]|uniref:Uncharacterized protein n=1 Tax=Actinomadura napierensis TaxID=267854 RepID=A0ABN3AFU8_9ACTN
MPDRTADDTLLLHFCLGPDGEMDYGPDRPSRRNDPTWREIKPLLLESPLLIVHHTGGTVGGGGDSTDGGSGPWEWWQYAVTSVAGWAALASVIKTWLTRRAGRKVVVYNDDGAELLNITGDLTATEIETLLRARVAPPELSGHRAEAPDEDSAAGQS